MAVRTARANRRSKPLRRWQNLGVGGGFPQAGVRRRTWEHRVDGRHSGPWKPPPLTRRWGRRSWLSSQSHLRVGSCGGRDRECQRFGSPPRARSKTPRRRSLQARPIPGAEVLLGCEEDRPKLGHAVKRVSTRGRIAARWSGAARAARRESGELGRSARERARESGGSWVLETKQVGCRSR